jgi:hypothetical protein
MLLDVKCFAYNIGVGFDAALNLHAEPTKHERDQTGLLKYNTSKLILSLLTLQCQYLQ